MTLSPPGYKPPLNNQDPHQPQLLSRGLEFRVRSQCLNVGTGSNMSSVTERTHRREAKRRSIWIVRPFDSGPENGLINVHSRLRGGMGMESLRAFV